MTTNSTPGRTRTRLLLTVGVLLTIVSFAGSYTHCVQMVRTHGQPGAMAFVIATMPEVSVFLCGLAALGGRRGVAVYVVGGSSFAFTIIANGTTAGPGPLGMVVALWPAWSAIGALWLTGGHTTTPPSTTPATTATTNAPAATVAPALTPAVPDVRQQAGAPDHHAPRREPAGSAAAHDLRELTAHTAQPLNGAAGHRPTPANSIPVPPWVTPSPDFKPQPINPTPADSDQAIPSTARTRLASNPATAPDPIESAPNPGPIGSDPTTDRIPDPTQPAANPADRPTPFPGASRSARPEDIERVLQLVAEGELPATPTAEAIRKALGIGLAYARATRDELPAHLNHRPAAVP